MRAESCALLLLAVSSMPCIAEEEAMPSLALLEYLGEWQDGEGHEIDPQSLALVQLDAGLDGGTGDDEK